MRILAISTSLLALAICAGCAQTRAGTAMGAAPSSANNIMCRDGAWTSDASRCGSHGGVERVISSPQQ